MKEVGFNKYLRHHFPKSLSVCLTYNVEVSLESVGFKCMSWHMHCVVFCGYFANADSSPPIERKKNILQLYRVWVSLKVSHLRFAFMDRGII